jgi:hypothetical protein
LGYQPIAMRKSLLFILMFAATAFSAVADVVEPGQIERAFKITNLSDFPQYKFYFMYTDFYYDQGYQPGGVTQTWIEQDSVYYTSDREASSHLYAVNSDGTEDVWESEATVGGGDFVPSEDISTVIDVIRITSVEGRVIKFKVEREIYVYNDGTTKEKKTGKRKLNFLAFGSGGGGNPTWLFWLLPTVSLLALGGFWLWRRKMTPTLQNA